MTENLGTGIRQDKLGIKTFSFLSMELLILTFHDSIPNNVYFLVVVAALFWVVLSLVFIRFGFFFINLGKRFLKLSHIFLPLLIQLSEISFQDLSCLRGLKQSRIKELSGIP